MSIFNLFAVKTKFEYQIEEYIEFKEKTSPFIAKDHKEILLNFKKELRHYSIAQLQLEDIREYHRKIRAKMTHFSTIKNMQAIRAFIRFHKAKTNIKADTVTNIGVKNLQIVGENVTVTPMIRKKVGRPLNIELAKKIKRLRDIEHLSFRAIGKAINQDVKSVYRWYKADLSDTNVG